MRTTPSIRIFKRVSISAPTTNTDTIMFMHASGQPWVTNLLRNTFFQTLLQYKAVWAISIKKTRPQASIVDSEVKNRSRNLTSSTPTTSPAIDMYRDVLPHNTIHAHCEKVTNAIKHTIGSTNYSETSLSYCYAKHHKTAKISYTTSSLKGSFAK